jgi:hypothetical protein
MEREFCSYEQSLALKELGFDEDCFVSFFIPNLYSIKFTATTKRNSTLAMGKDGCTAPLKQQVFKWFREKYELYYRISGVKQSRYHYSIDYQYKDGKWGMMGGDITTYEEAENACIDKLISICKQQDK